MTLFGITLNPKKLSDDEFVERQRENLRAEKRFAWVYLVCFAGFALGIPLMWWMLSPQVSNMPEESAKYFKYGRTAGFNISVLIALLVQALLGIVRGFNLFGINRNTEMLLMYFDETKKMAKHQNCEQDAAADSPRGH